jgi:hypothetical protein
MVRAARALWLDGVRAAHFIFIDCAVSIVLLDQGIFVVGVVLLGGWAREFFKILAYRSTRGVYHPGTDRVRYETWVPHPCGFQGCGF